MASAAPRSRAWTRVSVPKYERLAARPGWKSRAMATALATAPARVTTSRAPSERVRRRTTRTITGQTR